MALTIDLIDTGMINRLNLIHIQPPAENHTAPVGKLSEHFAGALHLSDETYETFQKALQEGRNEWARDIC
ncbi:hypothetical protein FACS1894200_09030 [Spirochaetia bacterium]|nr:hypothetical protein FACS1894200_09030 [Spirochaetia bacterium]